MKASTRRPGKAMALAASIAAFAADPGMAQTCNPVIDGTYCAENGVRPSPDAPSGSPARQAVDFRWSFKATSGDSNATLGAITFGSDGSRCVGLIRRVNCSSGP